MNPFAYFKKNIAPIPQEQSATSNTRFLRFSTKEQVLFAKRLSFLVHAGVSLVESMTIIRNQTKSKRKKLVFNRVVQDITAGQFLSSSLAKYNGLFSDFTINLIRVGENTGVLPENLTHLAEELAKKQALLHKVRGALIYPIFITVATFGVTGLLIAFIFPKIMPIFISLNIPLPLTTRVLLTVSTYLAHFGLITLLGSIVVLILFSIIRKLCIPIRRTTDWMQLKLPIIGPITQWYNCANFCRTLSLTLSSGVNLSEALYINAAVTSNLLYKNAYLDFASHVLKGETISSTMASYKKLFPEILPHMIQIGETTGNLPGTLGYLSQLYETEVEDSTKNLASTIEPVLLCTMGILVGLIAISIITPIYEVTKFLGSPSS